MSTAVAADAKVTSADIRAALKLRYDAQSHALLFEVANGTGGNGRVFADAVAFGLWPSHGHAIEGIEIKVSRSDFLSEMAKPQKSEPVFKYCDRWWLACPKGMVQPDEVPSTWGILEWCSGVLRTRVKAPKLTPEPMPRTFVASLLRRHAGYDEETSRVVIQREVDGQVRRVRDDLEREVRSRHSLDLAKAATASAAWQEVLDATGVDFRNLHDAGDFGRAVLLVKELNGGWGSPLADLKRAAQRLIKDIEKSGLSLEPDRG